MLAVISVSFFVPIMMYYVLSCENMNQLVLFPNEILNIPFAVPASSKTCSARPVEEIKITTFACSVIK